MEKQRLDEDKEKREEMEKNFDSTKELLKQGGKLIEFGQDVQDIGTSSLVIYQIIVSITLGQCLVTSSTPKWPT